MILVTSEKFQGYQAVRFATGEQKGLQLLLDNGNVRRFESPVEIKQWADSQGFELIKTVSVYRQIEIARGNGNNWYAFAFNGVQLFTGYKMKKESTVKELIDWHYNNA